ncbi:MAG: class I SAM-dependent methyltransferase [Flavobacteriales bacterium]|nr:class I SAM-dependent methyltransferase [Flavobacteriales bacterium]
MPLIARTYIRRPQMGWYTHWFGTPYYKLLYGHRDDGDAAAWVRAIAGKWQLDQHAQVLDLACGRGRHAKHFAALGFRITGVDISTESIAEGRSAVPDAEFIVHDMREPLTDARFDAVACLSRAWATLIRSPMTSGSSIRWLPCSSPAAVSWWTS